MKTELEILKGARELLSDPQRWYKGNYYDPTAERFCLLGSLYMAAGLFEDKKEYEDYRYPGQSVWFRHMKPGEPHMKPGEPELWSAMRLVESCVPNGMVAWFNDAPARTHQEVLNVLDCAIKRSQEKA